MSQNVFFTVIIPTRNRPGLFKVALESVLNQTFEDFEVIVINDGSSEKYLSIYKDIEKQYGSNVHFHYQIKRPNGHGQSYSMNTGAYLGGGTYLCFLDDDDYWTDADHLQRAHDAISSGEKKIDAYYSNQAAYFADGKKYDSDLWIADLSKRVDILAKGEKDSYSVTVEFLLSSKGFPHLNCSIIRRELYLQINGMDENIRYECDRDLFIRTLDVAENIRYYPGIVSRHNIPDKQRKDNMSTAITSFEKLIYQATVFQKGVLLGRKKAIRAYSRKGLSYIYKHMTSNLAGIGKFNDAAVFSKKALALDQTLKWRAYVVYLSILALIKG